MLLDEFLNAARAVDDESPCRNNDDVFVRRELRAFDAGEFNDVFSLENLWGNLRKSCSVGFFFFFSKLVEKMFLFPFRFTVVLRVNIETLGAHSQRASSTNNTLRVMTSRRRSSLGVSEIHSNTVFSRRICVIFYRRNKNIALQFTRICSHTTWLLYENLLNPRKSSLGQLNFKMTYIRTKKIKIESDNRTIVLLF